MKAIRLHARDKQFIKGMSMCIFYQGYKIIKTLKFVSYVDERFTI